MSTFGLDGSSILGINAYPNANHSPWEQAAKAKFEGVSNCVLDKCTYVYSLSIKIRATFTGSMSSFSAHCAILSNMGNPCTLPDYLSCRTYLDYTSGT